MSEAENDLQSGSQTNEVAEQCRELRRSVNLLLAGLIITSFTLTAYLGLEARRAAVLATTAKAQAERADQQLKQTDANVRAILDKFLEFGRTHPDFQAKVLSRYQIPTNAPAGAKK